MRAHERLGTVMTATYIENVGRWEMPPCGPDGCDVYSRCFRPVRRLFHAIVPGFGTPFTGPLQALHLVLAARELHLRPRVLNAVRFSAGPEWWLISGLTIRWPRPVLFKGFVRYDMLHRLLYIV